MNWTEPSKSYKSSDLIRRQSNKKLSTTHLNTPPKDAKDESSEMEKGNAGMQCPYHFNQWSHICITCRKTICLRCAITYCQQHSIYPQDELMDELRKDLQQFHVQPAQDEIEMKLKQSQQRQKYIENKLNKLVVQIQNNFQQLQEMINRKKFMIIEYYHQEFDQHLSEYKRYDETQLDRLGWLHQLDLQSQATIESFDEVVSDIKRQSTGTSKLEKKLDKLLIGKKKLKFERLWTEERLEKVLYEIEHIDYRINELDRRESKEPRDTFTRQDKKKKRVITENSDHKINGVSAFSPFLELIKSSSNSKMQTGRRTEHRP